MITFSKTCRLCITKTHSDYTIQFVDADSVTLADKIKIVCDIQINPSDCLPTSICELCLEKLRQFYEFKLSCLNSNRRLAQFKKRLRSSLSKYEKPQNTPVRSMKQLTQNTHLILNCITNKLKHVTSVQQQHSVQDKRSQLVKISLLETNDSAAQPSDNDDVASYNNDGDNADTMSYDDDTNIEDVTNSLTDNFVKQITIEDPFLMDDVTVNTANVESKTEEKLAHVDLATYEEKVEGEWMNRENEQSNTVESAKSANCSVDDTKDHIANEDDPTFDRSPVADDSSDGVPDDKTDGPERYDSDFCHICNKLFANKYSFVSHKRTYHAQHEENYQCDRCGKQFKRKTHYQTHMLRHTGNRPYKCDLCDKTFTDKKYLHSHAKTHSDARPYLCEICGKTFKNAGYIREHMSSHGGEKPFECSICGKAFTFQNKLHVHMRTHTGLRPFKCTTCGKYFPDSWALKKHNITHTTERKYRCNICHICFKRPANLKAHRRVHSRDPDERKLCYSRCEVCGKMLRSRDSLMKHAGVHSDERPFKCELCGKCFKYKSCWTSHQRIYHEGKTVECNVCGKSCTTNDILARHMVLHTGEKPHKCELCGKCFADPSLLRTHTIAHSNIKEHKCEYCGQEFKHRNNMMVHIWKKHSELITKTNNMSQESDEETTNDSITDDNEEEGSESMMVDNEGIPQFIIEKQASETIVAETEGKDEKIFGYVKDTIEVSTLHGHYYK